MSEDIFDKMRKHFEEMKESSFSAMAELAELDAYEAQSIHDECKLIDYALQKVIKYGTCQDAAEAIRHYVTYMIGSKLISLPR